MKIKIKNFNAEFDPRKSKMICVLNPKTNDVALAFEFDNSRLPKKLAFSMINMHNGEASDKKSQFEAMSKLGQEIANAWNEKNKL